MRTRTILLLLACAACGGAPSRRVTDLLGGETIERGARRVVAYRIDGMRGAGETAMHGYPVLGGPVELDADAQRRLRDVLLSDATYLWDRAKACEFLPGVLVRYEDDATIDVLFCFSCDELEVYRDGKRCGREDFDPRRRDLVALVQRIFPDDEALRALR